MRVLMLTQILPFPPDAGPRVKTWHVLRYLVDQGYRVNLISYVRPEETRHLPVLQSMCETVAAVPLRRSRVDDGFHLARSYLAGRPFLVERDDRAAMRARVAAALAKKDVDIIHADQLTMTQFAPPPNGQPNRPARLFDAHNATWKILDRMRPNVSRWLRPALAAEAKRIREYEGSIVRGFDHVLAVTENDREALISAADWPDGAEVDPRERFSVLPIAVDTEALLPVDREPGSVEVLTLGTLHYAPNAEGIRWFVREVFPLIRRAVAGVGLTIVGKNPPADFLRAAKEAEGRITVTGYVEDLTPYLKRSGVVVVPVLSGSGMRVRILEAMSRGMPVVTTTVGAEGIAARPGADLLLADTPEEFAGAVARVLLEPQTAALLSVNGRRLAETRYDLRFVLRGLDAAYEASLRRRGDLLRTGKVD
jgi:glycosyltransferase involved in cell wall biosynthesis